MNRHRLKAPVMAALLGGAVLAVAWAFRQVATAEEAQAGISALRTTRVRFETRLARLEQPVAAPELAPAEAGASRGPAGAAGAGPRARGTSGEELADPWALVMGDPVLQNLYLAAERASLAGRYAAVFAGLRLSAAQVGKIEDLILRRSEQRMDLDAIVRTKRLGDRDPAIARLRDRADQAFRLEMTGLLGDQAYQDFERYERALAAWELVNRFAGAVALEGQPLAADQATRLTETVAQASPPYRAGGSVDANVIDWPVVVAESTPILTEPQHTSFLNMAPLYPVPIDRP